LGVFKNGGVHFSKEALARMEKGDILGGAFAKSGPNFANDNIKIRKEKKEKVKMNYEEIMAAKEENSEFRTGKRFMKVRGAEGKIHRKNKSGGGKHKK
jgi:hypothetical protein